MVQPGGMLSHYRIVEKIGEGGMGIVYKALDTRLSRHVALKLLRPETTIGPGQRARLLREARSAAALNHASVATVHDIDSDGDTTFIVMELVEGRPLREILSSLPLPVADALRIARHVAGGLAHAHAAGIVHRDIKPENVIVRPDRQAKLLDFGLAAFRPSPDSRPTSRAEAEDTTTRDVSAAVRLAGTARYMSPEQARGEDVDARSDVFSFGVLLYEMLAGRPPFAGASVVAILAKVLEAEPEPLALARPELPPALDRFVRRCLSKEPAARPADGGALLAALRDLPAGQVPPEPPATRRGHDAAPAVEVSPATIAVFPFAVRGGREFAYLGAGLVDLLSTKLDGAGEVRSVDPHVMICCGTAVASDPPRAAALALRYGAGLFVLGSLIEVGGRLSLDATLYDSGDPRLTVARASARGEAAAIFDMVDRLTAELLAGRCGGPATRLARLGAVTTGSFDALKAYLEGEKEMRALRRVPAADAYRRAVEADPAFALAWYRLGVATLWSGQSAEAQSAARAAVDHAGRLSDRDRDLLEAFAAALRGDNAEAEARYRGIVGTHPDDLEAWYQLAELMFHCGPPRGRPIAESRPAWERLLFLDPRHVNGMTHLAAIESSQGERARVESLVREIERVGSGSDAAVWTRALRGLRGAGDAAARPEVVDELRRATDYSVTHAAQFLGAYLGELAASLEVARVLTDPMRSPGVRALGHVICAHLELSRGRPRAAWREIGAAAPLDPRTAAEYAALLALHPAAGPAGADLRQVRERLERAPRRPEPRGMRPGAWLAPHEGLHDAIGLYLEGLLLAGEGRVGPSLERAEALERMQADEGPARMIGDLAISVRAHAAAAEGRAGDALALLEGTRMTSRYDLVVWSPIHSRALERFARAELLARTGRGEEAAAWYRCFAENSIYDQVYMAPGLERAGDLAGGIGDVRASERHYARFVELWSGCEPELQHRVERARARLPGRSGAGRDDARA